MRQSWNDYFFDIAKKVATRSACIRRKVGAIAVNQKDRIIGTGYNGPLSGFTHCEPDTCYRTANNIPSGQQLDKCYAVHAEANLVATLGNRLQECTVYVTNQPCSNCCKLLITAGVVQIRWLEPYPDDFAMSILWKMGHIDKGTPMIWTLEKDMPF